MAFLNDELDPFGKKKQAQGAAGLTDDGGGSLLRGEQASEIDFTADDALPEMPPEIEAAAEPSLELVDGGGLDEPRGADGSLEPVAPVDDGYEAAGAVAQFAPDQGAVPAFEGSVADALAQRERLLSEPIPVPGHRMALDPREEMRRREAGRQQMEQAALERRRQIAAIDKGLKAQGVVFEPDEAGGERVAFYQGEDGVARPRFQPGVVSEFEWDEDGRPVKRFRDEFGNVRSQDIREGIAGRDYKRDPESGEFYVDTKAGRQWLGMVDGEYLQQKYMAALTQTVRAEDNVDRERYRALRLRAQELKAEYGDTMQWGAGADLEALKASVQEGMEGKKRAEASGGSFFSFIGGETREQRVNRAQDDLGEASANLEVAQARAEYDRLLDEGRQVQGQMNQRRLRLAKEALSVQQQRFGRRYGAPDEILDERAQADWSAWMERSGPGAASVSEPARYPESLLLEPSTEGGARVVPAGLLLERAQAMAEATGRPVSQMLAYAVREAEKGGLAAPEEVLEEVEAARKKYRVKKDGGIRFDQRDMEGGLRQAIEDGVVRPEDASQMMREINAASGKKEDNKVGKLQDFAWRSLITTSNRLNTTLGGVARFVGAEELADDFASRAKIGEEELTRGRGGIVNPALEDSWSGVAGRVVGNVASAAPALLSSSVSGAAAGAVAIGRVATLAPRLVGMAPMLLDMSATASEGAYQQAKASGKSDEAAAKLANEAALGVLPHFALYMGAGALTSVALRPLTRVLPVLETPWGRAAAAYAVDAPLNVAATGAIRMAEGGEFWDMDAEGVATDLAFSFMPAMEATQAAKYLPTARAMADGSHPEILLHKAMAGDRTMSREQRMKAAGIAERLQEYNKRVVEAMGARADGAAIDHQVALNRLRELDAVPDGATSRDERAKAMVEANVALSRMVSSEPNVMQEVMGELVRDENRQYVWEGVRGVNPEGPGAAVLARLGKVALESGVISPSEQASLRRMVESAPEANREALLQHAVGASVFYDSYRDVLRGSGLEAADPGFLTVLKDAGALIVDPATGKTKLNVQYLFLVPEKMRARLASNPGRWTDAPDGLVDIGRIMRDGHTGLEGAETGQRFAEPRDGAEGGRRLDDASQSPPESTPENLKGEKINREWTAFSEESGSLGVPRAEMPQIKAEARGALTQFLAARGIGITHRNVRPGELKPTQAEYSQAKVDQARGFKGGDRAILVSSDGHVVDGHHQWMAKLTDAPEAPMRVIELDAPIQELLSVVHEFPSTKRAGTPESPKKSGESQAVAGSKASVPVMITKRMEQQLRDRGFTQEEINKMRPNEAHEHLTKASEAQAVRAREEDVIPFSRSTKEPKKLKVAQVQQAVSKAKARWKNLPGDAIEVVQSYHDLPEGIRQKMQEAGAEGAYHDGKVYIVADKLERPSDAFRVAIHEVVGHYGLRGALGDSMSRAMDEVALRNTKGVREVAERLGLDLRDPEQRREAAEEYIAEATNPTRVGNIIRFLKSVLQKVFPGLKFEDDYVRQLLKTSREYLKGEGRTAEKPIEALNAPREEPFAQTPEAFLDRASRQNQSTDENRSSLGNSEASGETRFARAAVGMQLKDVGRDFVRDDVDPQLLNVRGTDMEVAVRAAEAFKKWPERTRAADGSNILLKNAESGSIGARVRHLIFDHDANRIHAHKAQWLSMVPQTLEHAAVRLVDAETGNRIYVREYRSGQKHLVIVRPDGSVADQKPFTGRLITQFPEGGRSRQAYMRIDWVREEGKGSGRFQGNPRPTPTDSTHPDARQSDLRSQSTPTNRPPQGNLDASGESRYSRSEEVRVAKPARESFTKISEAQEWASLNLKGKSFRNEDLGADVIISNRALDKALSRSALRKSSSTSAHLDAVTALPEMIKNGVLGERHADRNQDPNFASILRFYAPFQHEGKIYRAKLTVKEMAQKSQGNRFYTYELTEIEVPTRKWADANTLNEPTSAPQVGTIRVSDLLGDATGKRSLLKESGKPAGIAADDIRSREQRAIPPQTESPRGNTIAGERLDVNSEPDSSDLDIRFSKSKKDNYDLPDRGPVVEQGLKGWRRLFDGAADVLERTKGLEWLGGKVRHHYDRARDVQGKVSVQYLKLERKEGKKVFNQAEREVEAFYREKDWKGRAAAAEIERTMSPAAKEHLATWRRVAQGLGRWAQRLDVQVQQADGKYRSMGMLDDYHPRMVRREVIEAVRDPHKHPEMFREVVKQMKEAGLAKTSEEVIEVFGRGGLLGEISNDHFGNIEKARQLELPSKLYDYSFEARRRYMLQSIERLAQIEAYGQSGNGKLDVFEQAVESGKIRDPRTAEYISALRARVYGETTKNLWTRTMGFLNAVATGTMLTNPVTIGVNLTSGIGYTATTFGFKNTLKGFWEARRYGQLAMEAREKGVIPEDLMSLQDDADRLGSTAISKAQAFTGGMLKYTGYNLSEEIVRTTALGAAKAYVRNALSVHQRRPESRRAKLIEAEFKRMGVDPEKIYKEAGEGRETDKFYRASINAGQGGYKVDQTPIYIDTPVGRFFGKFQKWGTQASRNFVLHVMEPAVGKNGPVDVVPAFRYLVTTAIVGAGIQQAKELLFGTPDQEASFEEIVKKWSVDQRQAMADAFGKLFSAQLATGAYGALGNMTQMFEDIAGRSRFKNPAEPAGGALVKNLGEQVFRLIEQKKLTPRDLEDYITAQLSLYRTGKAMAGRFGVSRVAGARQDARWLAVQTRRFASEMGVQASRTQRGRMAKTPDSPVMMDLQDALLTGNIEKAKNAAAKYLDRARNPEERTARLRSLRQSVYMRQPLRVGSAGEARRELFLTWAKRYLPAEDMARVRRIDAVYRQTAEKSGLFTPKGAKPKQIHQQQRKWAANAGR